MWPRVSLRTQITVLFGLALVVVVLAHVLYAVVRSGPRIDAEEDNVVRLAREFVETAVASAGQTPNPRLTLAALVHPLQGLRQVRILFVHDSGLPPIEQVIQDPPSSAPAWFVKLVRGTPRSTRVPVEIDGTKLGYVLIMPRSNDEIGDIWDSLVTLVVAEAALAAILLLLTGFVVRRTLSPIGLLDEALGKLERRAYDTRVTDLGPPELDRIFHRFNSLAEDLEQTAEENRELTLQLVSVADDERRELGREIHDELGPQLFAIRAYARSLVSRASRTPAEDGTVELGQAILDQTDALQDVSRRILARLRPPALDELGLAAALSSLAAVWRETHPMEIRIDIRGTLDDLGPSVELTAYRLVQEALTNAARHAGASLVEVAVERRSPDELVLTVSDDGVGLPADLKSGYGMAGMSDRVRALSGRVTLAPRTPNGTVVEAVIPVHKPTDPSAGSFSRPERDISPLGERIHSPSRDGIPAQ
jgi:two-component system sensor histidine kinase UhpB